MAGLLKSNVQLGDSATASQNFTLTVPATPDGSMKLARGNAGATTQDILTVDASGNVLVDGNNLNLFSARSLSASGYQRLPGGLIVQWGTAASIASGSSSTVTFPVAFPNDGLSAFAGYTNGSNGTGNFTIAFGAITATNVTIRNYSAVAATATWFAIGY
jgi:hypothetical protein